MTGTTAGGSARIGVASPHADGRDLRQDGELAHRAQTQLAAVRLSWQQSFPSTLPGFQGASNRH
ncbi:MAG TPA: hypothetical protein VGG75_30740 [Trebonia sp.]|jgi:hypothetical protein